MARAGCLPVLPDLPDPGVRDWKVLAGVLVPGKMHLGSREPVLPHFPIEIGGGLSQNASIDLAPLWCQLDQFSLQFLHYFVDSCVGVGVDVVFELHLNAVADQPLIRPL